MESALQLPIKALPIAFASVVVMPDGSVGTNSKLIEAEHVPAVVEALAGLASRLLAFAREHNSRITLQACAALVLLAVDLALVPAAAQLIA